MRIRSQESKSTMAVASNVSLICYSDGNLINEDSNAEYVGGYRKAADISRSISFINFNEKIQSMMKLSSNRTGFKIKCGHYFDEKTLIAIDVDDDDSLKYMLDHAEPIRPLRVYTVKEEPSVTIMHNQRHSNNFTQEATSHGDVVNLVNDMVITDVSIDLSGDNSDDPMTNDLTVGQEFSDADTFRDAISDLAVSKKKEFKAVKSTKSKLVMRCNSKSCNWRLWARRISGLPTFKVTKYRNSHTCSVHRGKSDGDHRQATIKWIASKIRSDIEENPDMPPSKIITAMRNRFDINISYNKAVKAKGKASGVIFDESFCFLPGLIKKLEENGCVTELSCSKGKRFEYFFWAYPVCINAFHTHLHPTLMIDTIPIRRGVLMVAYGTDGVDMPFLIAFAIFEQENEMWWEKFLDLLKKFIISEDGLPLPFALVTKFDTQTTMVVVPKVFPEVCHCFYLPSVRDIFQEKFKDAKLESLMSDAAQAYDTHDCDACLDRIKDGNGDAYKWLLEVGKSRWCTAYAGSKTKFYTLWEWEEDLRILQIAELIKCVHNKVVKNLVDGQTKVAFCAEELKAITGKLNPFSEGLLSDGILDGERMRVETHDAITNEYQVCDTSHFRQYVVNLVALTCSCGYFQLNGIPCGHAAAVIKYRDLNIYDFCRHCVTAEAYYETYATAPFGLFCLEEEELHLVDDRIHILPPKRKVGRPRKMYP